MVLAPSLAAKNGKPSKKMRNKPQFYNYCVIHIENDEAVMEEFITNDMKEEAFELIETNKEAGKEFEKKEDDTASICVYVSMFYLYVMIQNPI